jgi:multicomponent Na+:H+ antiporter subunit E
MMKKLKYPFFLAEFIVFYLFKLVEANILMAFVILSPKIKTNSGLLEIPVFLKTRHGILIFSNLLSMTPGTLSIDISPDRKLLTLHVLFKNDVQKILHDIEKIQIRIERLTS